MTILRSLLFLLWFAVASIAMHLAALPVLLLSRRAMLRTAQWWARLMLFGLKWIAGLDYEVRGLENLPRGAALVAVKHYAMWETVAFTALLPDPAIVLKRELLRIPLYGWYAQKMGMIAIDRESGASAIRAMVGAAKRAIASGRQIVIFPEGTRRRPGDVPAYKPGVAALYGQLDVPCVPVAHNSGLYWIRSSLIRKPGTIVVEFLPALPPGLRRTEFMARLETSIETATNRLLAEAGMKGVERKENASLT